MIIFKAIKPSKLHFWTLLKFVLRLRLRLRLVFLCSFDRLVKSFFVYFFRQPNGWQIIYERWYPHIRRLGPGQKAFNQLRPGGRSPPVSYPVHVVFCLFLCVCLCCAFCDLVTCLYVFQTFCLLVSIILCSAFLCHISITISSSYLLFLYTRIHHCLYHTFPFLELFPVTALTF